MRGLCLTLLVLIGGVCFIPPGTQASTDDDNLQTLVLLQMIQQRQNPQAQQSLYPLLLTQLLKDDDSSTDNDDDNNKLFMLLLSAGGNDPNLQQYLPLILNNNKNDQNDKLLMLMFMQQNQVVGATGMNSMFPILLLNSNDDKYCEIPTNDKCMCEKDNSELLMYTMMFSGTQNNQMTNFMFLLFNDDTCKGSKNSDSSVSCECTKNEKIEGGIDMITLMMLMQMNPVVQNNFPVAPPQRAIDAKALIQGQLFRNLGPEYAWMANAGDAEISDLLKFQLYKQMGIPPNVMGLLKNGGASTDEEKFALVQYMASATNLNIETASLMLGIEDSKQFFVQRMIEAGQIEPLTASMLLASSGEIDKDKMKELLILAATGQVDPETFATIARPYVPQLPKGVYPGQDLLFIHLELLGQDTCGMIEPQDRKPCGGQFGTMITAEQCEVQPYCCYNPYFGKVNNVPWCYYNIFFVFHDQYKLKVREADKFKGPADCPGLFRYGLNLDPFLYTKAVSELSLKDVGIGDYKVRVSPNTRDDSKLAKLIHLRKDIGYEGISEFHCVAILGGCWDSKQYPLEFKIPQCYIEEEIVFNTAADMKELNLFDNRLFRPVVPDEYRSAEGSCETNYFKISTLYYERRACGYTTDMLTTSRDFNPLVEPSREDCLFRLGCCYEEDEAALAEYPFMPRCYKQVKNDDIEDRLFNYEFAVDDNGNKICGTTNIETEIGKIATAFTEHTINFNAAAVTAAFTNNQYVSWVANDFVLTTGVTGTPEICLFQKKGVYDYIQNALDFWTVYDVFPRNYLIQLLEDEGKIPASLKDMAKDLF